MGSQPILENHKAKSNHASFYSNHIFSSHMRPFLWTQIHCFDTVLQYLTHFMTRTHLHSAIILNMVRLTWLGGGAQDNNCSWTPVVFKHNSHRRLNGKFIIQLIEKSPHSWDVKKPKKKKNRKPKLIMSKYDLRCKTIKIISGGKKWKIIIIKKNQH